MRGVRRHDLGLSAALSWVSVGLAAGRLGEVPAWRIGEGLSLELPGGCQDGGQSLTRFW